MSMSPALPHELEESILRYLQYDPPTLKACSLVCYRFGIISQKFLFSNIVVAFPPSWYNTPKILTPRVCPFLLLAFLEATPRIAKAIRGIDVVADSYRLQDLDSTFLPCPAFLDSIRSISLDTDSSRPIYWRHLSNQSRRSLYSLSHSNQIQTMRFRRVFELPTSLITECRDLEELSLVSVTFQRENMLPITDGSWTPSPPIEPPRLKSLHLSISADTFRAFIDLAMASPAVIDVSELLKLSVTIFSPRFDYEALNSLLRAAGNSLETFCFSPMDLVTDANDAEGAPEQQPPLDLHTLPRLRLLRLRVVTNAGSALYKPRRGGAQPPALIIPSDPNLQSLEEVSIKADFGRELDGNITEAIIAPWAAIDTSLSAVASIRRVTVFTCQEYAELARASEDDVARFFPRLNAKGLLHVQAASSTLGFLVGANDTDLLSDSFRRHNML